MIENHPSHFGLVLAILIGSLPLPGDCAYFDLGRPFASTELRVKAAVAVKNKRTGLFQTKVVLQNRTKVAIPGPFSLVLRAAPAGTVLTQVHGDSAYGPFALAGNGSIAPRKKLALPVLLRAPEGFKSKRINARFAAYPAPTEIPTPTPTLTPTPTPTPSNQAPIARISGPSSVYESANATLSAAGSTDPDGSIAGYLWEQLAGPPLSFAPNGVQISFTAPPVAQNTAAKFRLTVTDNLGKTGSTEFTLNIVYDQPPQAVIDGAESVNEGDAASLSAAGSTDPDGGIAGYLWEQLAGPPLSFAPDGPVIGFTAPLVAQDTLSKFRLTVTDNRGKTGSTEVVVWIIHLPPVPQDPKQFIQLNDTGVTTCGDYAFGGSGKHSNKLGCAFEVDGDNDPVPPGQDAHHGRDRLAADGTLEKRGTGNAGFDFTKIDAAGNELPADAPQWSCVLDNTTGLLWEGKTSDGTLHDGNWTYSWYEPDDTRNGGAKGTQNLGSCGGTSGCDTKAFVTAVNAAGWCGRNDWRLPTREELLGLVDLGAAQPGVDPAFFPLSPGQSNPEFWSASPIAVPQYQGSAATISYRYGTESWRPKASSSYRIRLVAEARP